jgi:hypothetical protein
MVEYAVGLLRSGHVLESELVDITGSNNLNCQKMAGPLVTLPPVEPLNGELA